MIKKYYLKNLNELLKYRLTNLTRFAETSGIHITTLHRIKKLEDPNPNPRTLATIAHHLKMKVDRDDQGIYFYEPPSYVKEQNSNYDVGIGPLTDDEKLLLKYYKKINPEFRIHCLSIIKRIAVNEEPKGIDQDI